MNQSRQLGLPDFCLFLGIVLLALALRAGFLVLHAEKGDRESPFAVQVLQPPVAINIDAARVEEVSSQEELTRLIRNVRESNRYVGKPPLSPEEEPTSHYSPGYPWMVGLLARVVPVDHLELVVRWIQCVLGGLTAGLYYLFAVRAFWYRGVAVLAGLFCALHPFWIVNVAEIQDGVVTSFLLALTLYFGVAAIQTNGPFASLVFGLGLASLALVRASTLLFGFIGLAWFLLRSRHENRGWICSLLAFLGFVNGLAPWAVRNYQIYSEPVPVITSAWYHLWIGNNPRATGGPLTPAMTATLTEDQRKNLSGLSQPARYAELGKFVRTEVLSAPVATLNRRLHALVAFLLGDYFLQEGTVIPTPDLPSDSIHYEFVFEAVLLGMLLLAFLGWRWTYGWRKDSILAALALFWLPIPYLLGHAEQMHGPRLPLDGILLTYAAFTLLSLVPISGTNLLQGLKPSFERESDAI